MPRLAVDSPLSRDAPVQTPAGSRISPLPDPTLWLDAGWRIRALNPAAATLLAVPEPIGRILCDALPAEAGAALASRAITGLHAGVAVECTVRLAEPDRWYSLRAVPEPAGWVVALHDVTELKAAERRAVRAAGLYAATDRVARAVAAMDEPAHLFELACRETAAIAGAVGAGLVRFTPDGYVPIGAWPVRPMPAGEQPFVPGTEFAAVHEGAPAVIAVPASERFRLAGIGAVVAVPVRVEGVVWGALAAGWVEEGPQLQEGAELLERFSDLVSLAVGKAEIRGALARQARFDALTGLANPTAMHERLDLNIAAARPGGPGPTLILVDVDHFKSVNDGLGHETGDRVLQHIAACLRAVCGPADLAARVSGDEFALILESAGTERGLEVAADLRARLAEGCDTELPAITISAGLCAWEPGLDREALQRRAEDALDWAKLHGRDAAWAHDTELMPDAWRTTRARAQRRAGGVVDAAELQHDIRNAKSFWRSTLDALSKRIAVLEETGEIIAVNASWRRYATESGAPADRTGLGVNYLAVCEAADDPHAAATAQGIRAVLAGECEVFEHDYPCPTPGRLRWFTVRVNPLLLDGRRRVVVHHQDITDRREAEQRSLFQAQLLDVVALPVAALDAANRVTYWNAAAERLSGWSAEEVRGRWLHGLGLFDRDELDLAAVDASLALEGRWAGELTVTVRDGRRLPAAVTNTVLRDDEGAYAGVISTVLDLSESRAQRDSLKAARDYLQTVTESMSDGLVVFDADRAVTYCNSAACELLGAKGSLLGTDVVRLLYGQKPSPAAARLAGPGAEREAHDRFRRVDGTPMAVAWSADSLTARPTAAAGQDLIGAPAGGRVVVFRDVTERWAREQRQQREAEGLRWATRIREALDQDCFVLHAQPIVELATGDVVDRELLLRLRQDGGLAGPGEFLPAAEEHGLMRDIDIWVTQQAVGYAAAGVPVHFNLSGQSITDITLLKELRLALDRTAADPRLLTIELTETALLDDVEWAGAFARHVKNLGCRIALDDFGAGYNGFARVRHIPADLLKIDRQFVSDVLVNPVSEGVVRAVVALADNLGAETVGEGVEDEATQVRLAELGVKYAQGYHLGRPASFPPPG